MRFYKIFESKYFNPQYAKVVNLIIDIGNTLFKIGILHKNEIIEQYTWDHFSIQQLESIRSKFSNLNKVIISSVRDYPEEIVKYLEKEFQTCICLDSTTPIPLENLYESKETLGYDRIAACVGANFIYPNCNLLVIDAGTAITFDFVTETNQYLGGTISPGLAMRFKALHEFTGKLPLLEKDENYHIIGKNTKDAIVSGVQNGILFEVDEYINQLKLKYPNFKVILTGGDSIFFDKKLKNTIFVHPKILLTGLNRILNYNAK
ncbi:MAG: type III pantothenate kinase [Marinifilaceae bacterium]